MSKFLLIALPLSLLLTGCGHQLKVQTGLPAALRQPCPTLPPIPEPFVDPARALWEEAVVTLYGKCAGRMQGVIEATAK